MTTDRRHHPEMEARSEWLAGLERDYFDASLDAELDAHYDPDPGERLTPYDLGEA